MTVRALANRLSLAALVAALPVHFAAASGPVRPTNVATLANVDLTGTVTDSTNGNPLQSAEIAVSRSTGGLVSNTVTDAFGHFTIHNLAPGSYTVGVHLLGFRPVTRPFTVDASATTAAPMTFAMTPIGLNLAAVQVTATVPITVDTRTGDQVFNQNEYHGAPTNTTSQILQQSIAGAARAPTGEVHIRGQHAEYTYYIDGVPVPPGISGSLNELFDPQVVNSINFQTGGWDAEYGGRNAAVVNVTTKIPAGGFHGSLSSYAGSYDGSTTLGAKGYNGESGSMSGNSGAWGFFFSGARQYSDMRLEPVATTADASKVINFHNDGTDYFGFGKIQYTPSINDVVSLEFNSSQTRFGVPFDSSGGAFQNDHQRDVNSFVNLGWHHQLGLTPNGQSKSDLFTGFFYRQASLNYNPDPSDQPQFVFYPNVQDTFNLSEHRDANIYGVKLDYAYRPVDGVEFKVGTLSSVVSGHEDFSTFNAGGAIGPQSSADLTGHDIGVYGETNVSPVEWAEVRAGLRYDAHNAPFIGTTSQVSPRIRLNLYPSTSTTVYLYYGRQFMPTNTEDLRAITSAAQGVDVSQGTLPERDNFFEGGIVQRFPDAGLVAKLAAYHKASSPGIDDNTVPGSAIVTDVNIEQVRITGIEGVLEYRPETGPFSGYANVALNHAYGMGTVTGGFFPAAPPDSPAFDLDHDQRLSIVGSGTYSLSRFYLSGTAIYGSGLTNGQGPADCNCSYGTGLFDFNKGIHVDPSTIFNLSAGYTIVAGKTLLQPEVYVDNLFNKMYVLKGAFFSGPSVGRPRSIQFRVKASF
ncbi:MAG: TonB-dependent receptor [Gemmatimonadaceae bacterium]